jgi:hypothetical protein
VSLEMIEMIILKINSILTTAVYCSNIDVYSSRHIFHPMVGKERMGRSFEE